MMASYLSVAPDSIRGSKLAVKQKGITPSSRTESRPYLTRSGAHKRKWRGKQALCGRIVAQRPFCIAAAIVVRRGYPDRASPSIGSTARDGASSPVI
ncbi:MAG: hypothetical protein KKA44_04745 [Alphaproteobacteria bacterium]|nr:hypothetical protein [Alphaproteobacteria bacterium]